MWVIAIINMIGYVLQFQGQRFTSSSNAALIISTAALMVPILALLTRTDTITVRKIIGVLTGFVGTALVITHGASLNITLSELIGDFMILGTAVTIALIFVLSKPLTTIHSGRAVAGGIVTMTFLLLIPSILLDIGQPLTATIPTVEILVYLSLFATVGAYYFFAKGLETITPIVSSIILPIEVIVAVILSVIIFHDVFTIISAIGAILIVTGILLVTTKSSTMPENKTGYATSTVSTGARHSLDNY
jgi:drug/metabolite transporter (DMT)-like permease